MDREALLAKYKDKIRPDDFERLSALIGSEKGPPPLSREELERECAELRRDAKRYKWLRVRNEVYNPVDLHGPYVCVETGDATIYPDAAHLDAAIDAAISAKS